MGVQRKSYPTDLTDDQWEIASHLIPPAKTGGRPRTIEMREVVNALMYMVMAGGAWRMLPHDFPKWQTVYDYFRKWMAHVKCQLSCPVATINLAG